MSASKIDLTDWPVGSKAEISTYGSSFIYCIILSETQVATDCFNGCGFSIMDLKDHPFEIRQHKTEKEKFVEVFDELFWVSKGTVENTAVQFYDKGFRYNPEFEITKGGDNE